MPSSSSSYFTIFMDKKKGASSSITIDDLAAVKAAAWAWYQRGSRTEEKPPPQEFDVARAHLHHQQAFRPSRYKLEAMKLIKQCSTEVERPFSIHAEDNSLLDSYEIDRISKQLDDLLSSESSRSCEREVRDAVRHRKSSDSRLSSSSGNSVEVKKKKNNWFIKGLWMRHAVICGSRDDVDLKAFEPHSSKNFPVTGKHVPVVRVAICRPRTAHA